MNDYSAPHGTRDFPEAGNLTDARGFAGELLNPCRNAAECMVAWQADLSAGNPPRPCACRPCYDARDFG